MKVKPTDIKTLIIRDKDGLRDIGKVVLENGIVIGTSLNSKRGWPDPLRGMHGFIEKSVMEHAKDNGWKVSVDG